jgi:hypothetical protein
MAGGGLMQLVAYGAQDVYLTGNPQITFFKVVYRRHTNFSTEAIEQTMNGSVAASSRVSVTVSRNGDLVGATFLEVDAGTLDANNDNNYGTQIIDNIVLEIGGQQIDKQSGHFMETWFELTQPNETGSSALVVEENLTNAVTGGGSASQMTKFQRMACCGGVDSTAVDVGKIWIPLQFSFCRNPGLSLPLIALQYHEVKFNISFSAALNETSAKVWCDYHYLDTDERRRFAQVSHEYLIEQVQEQSGSSSTSQELNFNHPVKELIWTGAYTNASGAATAGLVQGPVCAFGDDDVNTVLLKLNGHDRFSARPVKYFTRVQVWQHHTGYGGVHGGQSDSIAVYSFALKPEEHQPSGTCNFSRIDNARLIGTVAPCPATGKIFAVNYNVLRIMSGMGGLAYSN